jgi:putative transposase
MGRKRHLLLVDTMGLILLVLVHPADVQDRDGAHLLMALLLDGRFSRLQLIWADAGYAGQLIEWVGRLFFVSRLRIEIVRRREEHKFSVIKWRWIVERTFGWLGRCRRLSKDYEALTTTSENRIRLAMISIMLQRLGAAPFQPT